MRGTQEDLIAFVSTLKGHKVMVKGNHDDIKDQHHGSILLYGHVHNSIEEYYFKKCLRDMNNEDFFNWRDGEEVLRAYKVGCMMPYMDYEPRSLTEIATRYERSENSVS